MIFHPVDSGMLQELANLVRVVTDKLEQYDYASALDQTEKAFWTFCDDYIELVKDRRYTTPDSIGARSATGALLTALATYLKLFAPYMPFVTEEVWSWWREGSIHRAQWPNAEDLEHIAGKDLKITGWVLAQSANTEIRRAKALQGLKMKSTVKATIRATQDCIATFQLVADDVGSANSVKLIDYEVGEGFQIFVTPMDFPTAQ